MAKIIGIDLGTTNSVVAVMEGSAAKVLVNTSGSRLTPSVVGFTDKGERLVGQIAKHQQVTNPENTVFSIKRFMGRRHGEVAAEEKIVPYKITGDSSELVKVDIRGKESTPPEISAMILQDLKKTAEDYLGEKVERAVITVPAHFDDAQRQLFERYMRTVYDVFKGHVAKGRGDKLRKDLDQMAGGRVYTGKQALELGLVDRIGGLRDTVEYAAAKVALEDYEVRVIPEPTDFITMLMEQYSGAGERPTDISVGSATSLLAGHPTLASLFDLLRKTEPQRAGALYQALQRVELIRDEGVIMMMPFDMILR